MLRHDSKQAARRLWWKSIVMEPRLNQTQPPAETRAARNRLIFTWRASVRTRQTYFCAVYYGSKNGSNSKPGIPFAGSGESLNRRHTDVKALSYHSTLFLTVPETAMHPAHKPQPSTTTASAASEVDQTCCTGRTNADAGVPAARLGSQLQAEMIAAKRKRAAG